MTAPREVKVSCNGCGCLSFIAMLVGLYVIVDYVL